MVTGNGPALAEAINMKRPGNALRPCRTCMIYPRLCSSCGLWSRTKLAIDKPGHEDFEVRSYHLDDEAIESISTALDAARATIPTYSACWTLGID